jgi:hypothetical protein
MGKEVISKIVFVCSDMWEPYLKLIRENCSEALHILDRFHIVANMNKALDNVRAEETSRMKREGRAPVLRKSRWLLLRRSENLGADQHFRLRDLLRYNLKTVRAYLLKEAFQQLWEYNSPAWAGKFLDEWRRQTMRSRIEPMKKIARSLRNHRELILNYFRAQKLLSSGVVEGLNNKAKVTMRKSYGFRTYPVLELALYHSLGKLPEPDQPTISSDEPEKERRWPESNFRGNQEALGGSSGCETSTEARRGEEARSQGFEGIRNGPSRIGCVKKPSSSEEQADPLHHREAVRYSELSDYQRAEGGQ